LIAGTLLGSAFAHAGDASIDGEVLRPRSSGGETLFFRIEPAESGIDFQIDIDDQHERRRLYEIAFAGAGIAVADFDDDGRPDIFMTHHSGADRLYRQVGDFEFEDVTEVAGLAGRAEWSSGATFVDVDNDGLIDLYVCYYDSPNALFINNGDGTFEDKAVEYGLDYRGASVKAAFADYDRDGDLDVYLLTSRLAANTEREQQVRFTREAGPGGRMQPGVREDFLEYTDFIARPNGQFVQIATGQRDVLYRNDGGRFQPVEFLRDDDPLDADNHMGMDVVWWDYNDDRWPDLYVANDLFGPDRLYRNNGDGSFSNVIDGTVPHTPWFSMGVDVGDINNDGKFDLMATDMSATSHYEEKVGMGDMASQGWFLTSARPRQYMRNAMYLNSGAGRFMEIAHLAGISSTDWTWSAKLNDLDNDGYVDLFITNGMVRNFMDADTQREIDAAHELEDYWEILEHKPAKQDTNLAFRNSGDLQFDPAGENWGLNHRGISFGAAISDLDRDGDLDLIVNNLDEPVSLYRNDSVSGGRLLLQLRGSDSNYNGVGAVVRIETDEGAQVRQLSPSRGFMSADEPVIHFGTGAATTVNRLTVDWPNGQVQVFENLPVDRFYTIREDGAASRPVGAASVGAASSRDKGNTHYLDVTAVTGLNFIHRELDYDDYAVQPLLPAKLSQLGPGVAWGDANGDGRDDVYIGAAAGERGALFLSDSQGRLQLQAGGPWEAHEHREDLGAVWFDADGDADLDLFVASGGVEATQGNADLVDRLYLNNGDGRFSSAPAEALPGSAGSSGVASAADFDGDGDVDVFVGGRTVPGQYPLSPESQLLRNNGGSFVDVTDELAPGLRKAGMVTGALWTDADNDDDQDLLVTIEWGPVRYFENDAGALSERTAAAGLTAHEGWWNGITSVDIDNDGDSDYVITNVGLNTKYETSHDEPATLYYGDFAGSGQPNLIEVHWEDRTELPVRGLSCSSGAMPFIADEFGTFDQFARADINDLFSPAKVETADRYTATEFKHGLLINDGGARFEFRPLPMLAQIAPAYGVVTGDFDLDGNADVYLVQNSFSPQPETGRMDGGLSLLMLGDGQGGLEPVWPDESGLIVPGDAKALTTTDLNRDGRADFVISRNDDSTMVFQNARAEGQPLAIRVAAVGSRVQIVRADGSVQSAEIHAGSGYLSQSAPVAYFGNAAGNPIEEIRVRWPDGRITSHEPSGDPVQTISR
jgi:hypothetical protein